METSPFAKDPRLDAVPPELRALVVAEADNALPYCENNNALSSFFECGCVGQRVFDHRIETADYALAPPTLSDIKLKRTPAPKFAKSYTMFFMNQQFEKRLKTCVVPEKVQAYARAYVAKMASLSPAARECAVSDFQRAFNEAPTTNMSAVNKTLRDALLACSKKPR
jgi:hypothetical protein